MDNNFFRTLLLCLLLPAAAIAQTPESASLNQDDAPTIAHIHIGHTISGWPETPGNQGLLVFAELASIKALASSDLLLKSIRDGELERSRKHLKAIAMSVDPGYFDERKRDDYGLRRAAAETLIHLRLAAEMPDASTNVQQTVARVSVDAQAIIDRADELVAFLEEGMNSSDTKELQIIAEEIASNLAAISGKREAESVYGLYELREDIGKMIANEDPPYQPVDSWHLFNLVKLPDGEWGFSSHSDRGAAGAGH